LTVGQLPAYPSRTYRRNAASHRSIQLRVKAYLTDPRRDVRFAADDEDQHTLWMILGAAPVPLTTSGSSPTSKTRTGRYLKFAFVKDHGFGRASTFVLVGYISD